MVKNDDNDGKRKPGRRRKSHWGWWVIGILLVAGIAVVAVPNFLRGYFGPGAGGETSFVSSIRTICTANVSYQYSHPKQGYARTLADLGPKDGNYIDAVLASGEKSGYRYEYVARPESSGIIEHYRVTARPEVYGKTGERSLYSDESCDIHTTKEDRAPTASDPPL
jgi:hypothetical protein